VDHCCELLRTKLEIDLRDVVYPDEEGVETATRLMTQTAITQPALFVVEYALARLWMAGVRPAAMIGHSIGEYVAACLAGVFSLEDVLPLLAARGRLMQNLPGGVMLAVLSPQREIQSLLGDRLSLAAVNAHSLCVVSGPRDAVEALESKLADKGMHCRRLHASHAFHSEMMDPILAPFAERVSKVNLNPPKLPYISNVSGSWITAVEATSPSYWARHLQQTVRFAEGLNELSKEPNQILLEVGPGQTLSSNAKRHRDKASGQLMLSSLRHSHDRGSEVACLLNTLGQLWIAGTRVNWPGFSAGGTTSAGDITDLSVRASTILD
jgi:acyl transferase domain-containing protein